MLLRSWLFILKLLASAATHSVVLSKPEIKDRKINLALETVLEFNNKDNTADIKFLDNVQQFIGKVKKVIDKNNLRRDGQGAVLENFTDFIHKAINVILQFEDDDLENFFSILSDELRKYHYRGCKFHELTENYGLRKFIASELDAFKHIPAESIRNKILVVAKKIEEADYNSNEKELVDFVNSLYRQDSIDKFSKILVSIDDYRLKARDDVDLVKIVREGIRSIIFDHYSELNHNAREALKSKINEYWKYLVDLSKTLVSELNAEQMKFRNDLDDKNAADATEHEDYDLMTETTTAKSTSKSTKKASKTLFIHLTKQVKHEKQLYHQATTEKSKSLKLTFKTLFPEFASDYSLPKFRAKPTYTIKLKLKERDKKKALDRKPRPENFATEVTLKLRQKRLTTKKWAEFTTRQMYIEKIPDVRHRQKLTSVSTSSPKLTFMTLYPAFDDHTTRKPGVVKKMFSTVPIGKSMQTIWHETIPSDKGEPRAVSKDRKILVEFLTKKPASRKTNSFKRFKYEITLQPHDRKNPDLILKKSEPDFDPNPKMTRKSLDSLNYKMRADAAKRFILSPIETTSLQSKANNRAPVISVEGFSVELMGGQNRRAIGKRYPKITKDSEISEKDILTKIKDLERELKVVRTQVKNDTQIIKYLNNKLHRKENNYNDYNRGNKYDDRKSNFMDKPKPVKEVVFDLSARINLDNNNRLRKDSKAAKAAESNIFKFTSYTRDQIRPDAHYETNENKRNKKINYDFGINSFNKDKYVKRDKVKLKEDKKINTGSSKINMQRHELMSFDDIPSHAKPYGNHKIKRKEHNFIKNTIQSRDYYGNYNYATKKSSFKKPMKQRFELKSFSDEKLDNFAQKMKKTKHDYDRINIKKDIKKPMKQRFELKSFSDEKIDNFAKKTEKTKHDYDRININKDNYQDRSHERKYDENKYFKNSKSNTDLEELRKEQEKKYYSNVKMYDMDKGQNKKNKERIYDSDSNRQKTDKINYTDRETQKHINDKINKFNHHKDMHEKKSSSYEKYTRQIIITRLYDSDTDYKRNTIDRKYDTIGDKFVKTTTSSYKSEPRMNNYDQDKRNILDEQGQEIKRDSNDLHNNIHYEQYLNKTNNDILNNKATTKERRIKNIYRDASKERLDMDSDRFAYTRQDKSKKEMYTESYNMQTDALNNNAVKLYYSDKASSHKDNEYKHDFKKHDEEHSLNTDEFKKETSRNKEQNEVKERKYEEQMKMKYDSLAHSGKVKNDVVFKAHEGHNLKQEDLENHSPQNIKDTQSTDIKDTQSTDIKRKIEVETGKNNSGSSRDQLEHEEHEGKSNNASGHHDSPSSFHTHEVTANADEHYEKHPSSYHTNSYEVTADADEHYKKHPSSYHTNSHEVTAIADEHYKKHPSPYHNNSHEVTADEHEHYENKETTTIISHNNIEDKKQITRGQDETKSVENATTQIKTTDFITSKATVSTTVNLTTPKTETTTPSTVLTVTSSIFTDTKRGSTASITAEASLPDLTSPFVPTLTKNVPHEGQFNEFGELEEFGAMDPMQGYDGMRKSGDTLSLLREYDADDVNGTVNHIDDIDNFGNETVRLHKRRNESDILEREVYEYINEYDGLNNVSSKPDFAPPPNFQVPPVVTRGRL